MIHKRIRLSQIVLAVGCMITASTLCMLMACMPFMKYIYKQDLCMTGEDVINMPHFMHDQDGDVSNVNKPDLDAQTMLRLDKKHTNVTVIMVWTAEMLDLDVTCGIHHCRVTSNISALTDAEAIVVNSQYPSGLEELYQHRISTHGKLFVLVIQVPPTQVKTNLSLLNGLINLTSSYNVAVDGSDIPLPYGRYHLVSNHSGIGELRGHNLPMTETLLRGKRRLAVWFVKPCRLLSAHRRIIHQLQQTIPVDLYGPCMPLNCGDDREECLQLLRKYYIFYLAFENANCHHYITDEFYEALQHDFIPVVMGTTRGDYDHVAPPDSFIHVNDFKSVTKLARYLKRVSKDEILYQSYFKWKESGYVLTNKPWPMISERYWCDVYKAIHNLQKTPKIYWDLDQWWTYERQCSPLSLMHQEI